MFERSQTENDHTGSRSHRSACRSAGYKQMQKNAPECLDIEVHLVKIGRGAAEDQCRCRGQGKSSPNQGSSRPWPGSHFGEMEEVSGISGPGAGSKTLRSGRRGCCPKVGETCNGTG